MTKQNNQRPAALITGGAVRLGKAIALALAEQSYDIALHYHSSGEAAEQTAAEIRTRGVDCATFQQDLRNADQFDTLMRQITGRFPRLVVLINSASAYESGTIAKTAVDTFDTQFALNLRAPFFLTQAFSQQVAQGVVINIIDNKIGFNQFEYAAYLLAKKGLVELTKMAALEFAPQIRVNGVAPGVVLPATSRSEAYVQWRIEGIPLRMQGETSHITEAIIALLNNPFLTGQILTVDGGETLANTGRNATQFNPDQP